MGYPYRPTLGRNPVAKTAAQLDKRKRDTEKRKKLEKVIKQLAAEMPEPPVAPQPHPSEAKPPEGPGVKCLRCGGVGHLIADCDKCKGRGAMVVSCRKCSGKGVYAQKAGPCERCEARGILADGTTCPRCKGHKVQLAFSTPCAKCAGRGSLEVTCRRCGGSLKYEAPCGNCGGTGRYHRK